MTVDVIVVGIFAILFLGLAIYLWIDRKKWLKKSLQRMIQICTLQEELKETKSLLDALDKENEHLCVEVNQYEALLQTRLDEIPVADISGSEAVYPSENEDDGVGGWSKDDIDCNSTSFKKPCCSCDNGVYNTAECIGCGPENSYENYAPIKY